MLQYQEDDSTATTTTTNTTTLSSSLSSTVPQHIIQSILPQQEEEEHSCSSCTHKRKSDDCVVPRALEVRAASKTQQQQSEACEDSNTHHKKSKRIKQEEEEELSDKDKVNVNLLFTSDRKGEEEEEGSSAIIMNHHHTPALTEAGILFTAAALALANQSSASTGGEGGGTGSVTSSLYVQDMDIPLSVEDMKQHEEQYSLKRLRSGSGLSKGSNSMRRIQSMPHFLRDEEGDSYEEMTMTSSSSSHHYNTGDTKSCVSTADTSTDCFGQQSDELDEVQRNSGDDFVPSVQYRFDPPEFNSVNFPESMDPRLFIETVLKCNGLSAQAYPALELQNFFLDPTDEHLESYDKAVLDAVHNEDVVALRNMHLNGKNLQCCNRFGESLLHMVCRRGFVTIAAFLIHEAGISLRVRDDCGRTPLHDACWATVPAYELVELLIAEEPDLLLISDKRGHTPFQYARREHWHYWRKFLYDRWDLICPRPGRQTIMIKTHDVTRANPYD